MAKAFWIVLAVIVIALIVGGILLFSGNAYKMPSNNPTNPSPSLGSNSGSSGLSINIQNFAFNPASLTVNVGDTVVWTNSDSAPHTVTSDSGSELSSGTLANGQTFSHTFNSAGTFNYHCTIHTFMKGTIIVK